MHMNKFALSGIVCTYILSNFYFMLQVIENVKISGALFIL